MSSEDTATNNPKHGVGLTKPPTHYIPPTAILALGIVMMLGARKYGAFNWAETGVSWSVYYDAAMRHLFQALMGADEDPESGVPHEAHVMACMAIIIDARARGVLHDDRSGCDTAAFDGFMTLMRDAVTQVDKTVQGQALVSALLHQTSQTRHPDDRGEYDHLSTFDKG